MPFAINHLRAKASLKSFAVSFWAAEDAKDTLNKLRYANSRFLDSAKLPPAGNFTALEITSELSQSFPDEERASDSIYAAASA